MSPPASMTKLMTFAVLCDELAQRHHRPGHPGHGHARGRQGRPAQGQHGGVAASQGEAFTVDELIYAMMIQSANDAAYALAHKAGGTVQRLRRA